MTAGPVGPALGPLVVLPTGNVRAGGPPAGPRRAPTMTAGPVGRGLGQLALLAMGNVRVDPWVAVPELIAPRMSVVHRRQPLSHRRPRLNRAQRGLWRQACLESSLYGPWWSA